MSMKKLPPIAEWTPPWADGEFDEDKAKGLIYNLTRDSLAAKDKVATLASEKEELSSKLVAAQDEVADLKGSGAKVSTEAKDEENRTLRARVRDLERSTGKRTPEDQAYIDRLEVANDHGLSAKDARRLQGATRDELEEDAKEFVAMIGKAKGQAGEGEGSEESNEPPASKPPQRGVIPAGQFKTGANIDGVPTGDTRKVLEGLPPLHA